MHIFPKYYVTNRAIEPGQFVILSSAASKECGFTIEPIPLLNNHNFLILRNKINNQKSMENIKDISGLNRMEFTDVTIEFDPISLIAYSSDEYSGSLFFFNDDILLLACKENDDKSIETFAYSLKNNSCKIKNANEFPGIRGLLCATRWKVVTGGFDGGAIELFSFGFDDRDT